MNTKRILKSAAGLLMLAFLSASDCRDDRGYYTGGDVGISAFVPVFVTGGFVQPFLGHDYSDGGYYDGGYYDSGYYDSSYYEEGGYYEEDWRAKNTGGRKR